MKIDKRKFNGGARPNPGPKPKAADEKKEYVYFYVKHKHVKTAKEKIQPIIDDLNSK